jgi:hypothetical protein
MHAFGVKRAEMKKSCKDLIICYRGSNQADGLESADVLFHHSFNCSSLAINQKKPQKSIQI